MKPATLRHFGPIFFLLILIGQSGSGKETLSGVSMPVQPEAVWSVFVPEGEEFAATIPGPVTVLNEESNYVYKRDGEKVLQHRDYSGYGDGLVFIVESYQAKHPKEILGPVVADKVGSAVLDREIPLTGATARLYRPVNRSKFYSRLMYLVTKQHIYLVTLTTLEETNPAIDRFVSSFRLRNPQDTESAVPVAQDVNQAEILNAREVTRKAVIAWKPQPVYTERARAHGVMGTVSLEGVFAANGYVTNIKVIKGMSDGMTERAIEYTRSIRFFPAEKNGKPVSQVLQVEYNFRLF